MTETLTFGAITEMDVDMPMRDGVILRGNVFRPADDGKYPGLLMRTPYGKWKKDLYRLVRAGYVVVSQDSRGRYASDGTFIPMTSAEFSEGEDGYDSVEWLAAQPYCNGKVGTFGVSYGAFMQWALAKLRPPHLLAMAPWSIPVEKRDVDYTGSFRPGRRVKWLRSSMAPDLRKRHGLKPPHTPAEARPIWEDIEQGLFLGLLPWSKLPDYLPPELGEPFAEWIKDPARPIWKFDEAHREIEVPHFSVTGYYDHCCSIGNFLGMQKNGATEVSRSQSKIIIGPWAHSNLCRRHNGPFDFGPNAELDRYDLYIRWFDHWLKDRDNGVDREPAVRYFVMGSNQWRSADSWPPPLLEERSLFLHSNGNASQLQDEAGLLQTAQENSPADTYTYDPRDPVPTLWDRGLTQLATDRRKLEYRDDIMYYRTAPLEEELEIAGNPEVALFISTTAPDTDFFACLVDEYPDGTAMEICHGMVRIRHRNSLQKQELIEPGEVVELRIQLGLTACRFQRGHRIRLEITSSDFPNYDRNHNTGGNDLFETELLAAQQTIYHDSSKPSRLILPVTHK